MSDREDWLERWAKGALYRDIAADAGVGETTVGEWFRRRGFYRQEREAYVRDLYSEYPGALRRLILFYPEGSPQRQWMTARVADWCQRRWVSVKG